MAVAGKRNGHPPGFPLLSQGPCVGDQADGAAIAKSPAHKRFPDMVNWSWRAEHVELLVPGVPVTPCASLPSSFLF